MSAVGGGHSAESARCRTHGVQPLCDSDCAGRKPPRNRFCCCSRADNDRREARAICVLHGNTDVAKAYREGMKDALNGHAVPEARPIRAEDR